MKTIAYQIGRSRTPTMTHGTSVESAIELIEWGRTKPPEDGPWHHDERGFMYFSPIKKAFRRHWFHDEISEEETKLSAIKTGADYAQLNQYERIMREHQIPFPTRPFDYCEVDQWLMGNIGDEELIRILGRECPDIRTVFGREEWQKARRQLEDRRGIVIELNKRALRLELYDEDLGGEIKIHLPDGLSLEYVHRIIPCGKLEEQTIDETLQTHQRQEIRKVKIRSPFSN